MFGLLYFGRLDKEKGVDGIIDMVRLFAKEGKIPFELFIFGSGSLESEILELTATYKEIHFFGWKSREEIQRYVQNCQYCLMPSTFLETFGLSALTALTWGLPVIGYKKGGLIPFVEDTLDLGTQPGKNVGKHLYSLIKNITNTPAIIDGKKWENLYSKEAWVKNIHQLLGDKKKILLVSDFISKVGGIETYIHDVKKILEDEGYEVELFGTTLAHGFWGKTKKLLGIGLGVFNIYEALRLRKVCNAWQPEVIWFNSTLRRLGWMPLWSTRKSKSERWMMYHDFGYFYPYPSQLTDIQQIKTPMNIKHFFAMNTSKNPIRLLLLLGKYIALSLLKKQLKYIDKHLVPSDFMKNITHKSYTISDKKIQTLAHFLQD